MQPLQQYNPSMPQQQKDQLFTANFNSLNQYCQFEGISLIASVVSQNGASIGTSYAATPFSLAIQSSGSLTVIVGNFFIGANGDHVYLQLLIDGNPATTFGGAQGTSSGGYQTLCASLFWAGYLAQGKHNITIQAKAGSSQAFDNAFDSGFYVLECRQG